MVSLSSLWIPILLSAAVVFVASSIIHMMLSYHRSDYRKLEDEDGIIAALRPFGVPPGDYILPHGGSPDAMKSPEFADKVTKGPVIFMTVLRNEMPAMGSSLIQWFVYCVVVSVFAAYITGRAVAPAAGMMPVLQFAGTTAFMGYGLALAQNSIWYKRAWSTTLKSMADSLVYGVLTGLVFGWFW